jgi:hypothetical protein
MKLPFRDLVPQKAGRKSVLLRVSIKKAEKLAARGLNIPVLVGKIFQDLFKFIPVYSGIFFPDIPGLYKGKNIDPSQIS